MALDLSKKVEEIVYDKKEERIFKVQMFCDNIGVLESILSSKQVEGRFMRSDILILMK